MRRRPGVRERSAARVDAAAVAGAGSGNSTGPHLHFEVRHDDNTPDDPYSGACGGPTSYWNGHDGTDIGIGGFAAMDVGRTVVAAAAGTVQGVRDGCFDRCTSGGCSCADGFGNYVRVDHVGTSRRVVRDDGAALLQPEDGRGHERFAERAGPRRRVRELREAPAVRADDVDGRDAGAEWVALQASGALVAPQSLYDRVVCEVGRARASLPETRFPVQERHVAGHELQFGLADAPLSAVSATTLQCLTDALRPSSVEDHGSFRALRFGGLVNTPVVKDRFLAVDGVVSWGAGGLIGDGDELRLGTSGDVHRYAFVRKGGDCPSGCTEHTATLVEARADGSIEVVARSRTVDELPPPGSAARCSESATTKPARARPVGVVAATRDRRPRRSATACSVTPAARRAPGPPARRRADRAARRP